MMGTKQCGPKDAHRMSLRKPVQLATLYLLSDCCRETQLHDPAEPGKSSFMIMSEKPRIRQRLAFLLVAMVLSGGACQKKSPLAEEVPATTDHVAPSPVGSSQIVLQKTFTVSGSAKFPFEIPAHAATPRLRGNYKSFVGQPGVQSNDDTANVDFLILTEDQYADFAAGRASEALFSANAAHDQDVDVSLPASQDQPQKYYFIFRNTPGGATKKVVQAGFRVDF